MIYMDDDTIIEIAAVMVGAYENNAYMQDACAEISYHYPEIDKIALQNTVRCMWMAIDKWINAHPEDE